MRSSDPGGVMMAARVLTMPLGDLAIRAGPARPRSTTRRSRRPRSWSLATSATPAAGRARMLESCALYGNCKRRGPSRAHLLLRLVRGPRRRNANLYYTELQRARAGDWSYFNFNRGPAPRVVTTQRPR
jgi:hypothetical protein